VIAGCIGRLAVCQRELFSVGLFEQAVEHLASQRGPEEFT
jgi:hypothetical protein